MSPDDPARSQARTGLRSKYLLRSHPCRRFLFLKTPPILATLKLQGTREIVNFCGLAESGGVSQYHRHDADGK
jgi:hypothetical protein